MNRSTACLDWEKRIKSGASLVPAPLYPEQAAAGLGVFNELRIADVPGCPTMGEACKPWLPALAGSIFGAYNVESGEREITEWMLSVSKKNFKSGFAAGIMLTALVKNWRESAEYGILAPTVEVANNSFYPARDMIRKDERLEAIFHVQDHTRTITHRLNGATLRVIAAESDSVGGKKFTGIFIDELWLFGKRHGAADMFREATGGLASRPEGFAIYATTMSNEQPAGVHKEKLLYARKVRDGVVDDPRFVPCLYEHPQAMIKSGEHRNPKNFYMTNPNLGASVSLSYLEREMKKAEEDSEVAVVGFMAKHLNVEIGLALRSDRWAGADFWQRQGYDYVTLDLLLERSEVITAGIDGGGLDDLLGLAVVGRDKETGRWIAWCKAWAHPSVLERRKSEAPKILDFAKDGDLSLVERVGDDCEELAEIVGRILDSGLLDRVGVDPAGLGGILDALSSVGVAEDDIIGIPQGWKLNGAIKTTERKLAAGDLIHSGAAMMAWAVSNAKVEPRGNAITITKQASGFAKIDPLMALFNAVSLMALSPEAKGGSFWETVATSEAASA